MANTKPSKSHAELKVEYERLDVVQRYLEFNALSRQAQIRLWNAWERYFKDVRKTVAYAMYMDIRKSFVAKDYPRMYDLIAQMRTMRRDRVIPELAKPDKRLEPQALFQDQSVIRYRNLMRDMQSGVTAKLEF